MAAVTEGGQADRAGVQPGWLLKAINGAPVRSSAQMVELLQAARAGRARTTVVSFAFPAVNAAAQIDVVSLDLDLIPDPAAREVVEGRGGELWQCFIGFWSAARDAACGLKEFF